MNRNLEGVKAVIFDMDGTILDSEPLHARAIQAVFKKYDISMSTQEIMDRYIGWGDDNVYKDKKELHTKITHEEFITEKDKIFLEVLTELEENEFKNLFAVDFFNFLGRAKAQKLLVAVVSASARVSVDAVLSKADILDKLDYTLTRDEVFETKPSPACYLQAMRFLKVKSFETLIFEDSHHGLTSALASGAKVKAIDLSLNDKSALKTIDNRELESFGNYSWLI